MGKNGILSKSDVEVMNLVKLGYANKQIGKTLGITLGTVERHLNSIAQCLHTSSRAHAVYLCMKRGIID